MLGNCTHLTVRKKSERKLISSETARTVFGLICPIQNRPPFLGPLGDLFENELYKIDFRSHPSQKRTDFVLPVAYGFQGFIEGHRSDQKMLFQ